jgi:hypothetical protein
MSLPRGDSAEGSIAEAFGRFDFWDAALFELDGATPLLPKSSFAIAMYELPEDVQTRDLDDAHTLVYESLRPSEVATRNRDVTQAWAMRTYARGNYVGVRWWSYYDATWHSLALWDISRLVLIGAPQRLHSRDHAVEKAATIIVRRIIR